MCGFVALAATDKLLLMLGTAQLITSESPMHIRAMHIRAMRPSGGMSKFASAQSKQKARIMVVHTTEAGLRASCIVSDTSTNKYMR